MFFHIFTYTMFLAQALHFINFTMHMTLPEGQTGDARSLPPGAEHADVVELLLQIPVTVASPARITWARDAVVGPVLMCHARTELRDRMSNECSTLRPSGFGWF